MNDNTEETFIRTAPPLNRVEGYIAEIHEFCQEQARKEGE